MNADWIVLGLASSVGFAVVTTLDKRLLIRHFHDVRVFNVLVGVTQSCVAVLILAIGVALFGLGPARAVLLALVSGVLFGVSLSLFFYALSRTDVSRATPIWLSSPIFAAVLALLFLGDEITGLQWAAIFLVVVGAILVSYSPARANRGFLETPVVLALVVAAIVQAVAFVVNKEASDELHVWVNNGWRSMGFGVGIISLNISRRRVRDAWAQRSNPRGVGLLVLTEGLLAPLSGLALVASITLGPVALASAVTSTRPLFLLAISTALSTRYWQILNEPLDRDTLALKALSTILIVGGTSALAVF